MNSSRTDPLRGCALALSLACAGCPGLADGSAPDAGSSQGSGAAEGGVAPPIIVSGPSCLTSPVEVAAVEVRVSVSWDAVGMLRRGTGTYAAWLLARYAIDGQDHVQSTTRICRLVAPPIARSNVSCGALGPGSDLDVRFESPVSEWKKVTKTIASTGDLGGRTIGSSFAVDSSVFLYGLSDASRYITAATPWPAPGSPDPFALGDPPHYVDEEGQGTPGITFLLPDGDPGSPANPEVPLDLTSGCGIGGPASDRIFAVLRLEMSLYGTRTSCIETSGTANVSLLDSRIVGCDVEGDGGACTNDQSEFVDLTWPKFVPGPATFEQVLLSAGDSATCDDVVAALPEADE